MTEENKPTIRKVVFATLVVIASLSLLNTFNITRKYEDLQGKYIDQAEDYRQLKDQHNSMVDQYWLIQQQLLKQ